jgi:endonuclease III
LDKKLEAKVLFEISQIDKLISNRKTLIDSSKEKVPDDNEIAVFALVLHSFYTGVEKILEFIFKDCKEKVAENANSHKELLAKAFTSNANRGQIFKDELQDPLDDYLKFRHRIRHTYEYHLEWSKMENLIKNLESVWNEVKESVTEFIDSQQDSMMKEKERIKEFIDISKRLRNEEELRNKNEEVNFFRKLPKNENMVDIEVASTYLKDLKRTPHYFVLGCVMDMGIQAEYAWIIPFKVIDAFLKEGYIKNNSINELINVEPEKYKYVFDEYYNKKLHRYDYMCDRFYRAVIKIKEKYNGDASKIWGDKSSSAEVVKRFREFKGVGQKISTMAANILTRDFKIPFSDYKAIDISLDKHVMHVMGKLGFVQHDEDPELFKANIVLKARELYPDYPGIFDLTCFKVGREYCKNSNPNCKECILNRICSSSCS